MCCQSVSICLSEVFVISLWRYSVLPKCLYLSFRGICYFFVEIQCAAKDLHSVSICLSEVYVISLWRYSELPKIYTVFLFVFQRYILFLCGDTVFCQRFTQCFYLSFRGVCYFFVEIQCAAKDLHSVSICLSEVYVISLWRYSVLPKSYTVFLFVFQRYMLFLCGDTVCCQRFTQCFYLSFRGICYFFVEIQCAAKDLHSVSICLSEVYVISLWRYSVLPKIYTVFLFVFQRYMLFLCGDTVCCQRSTQCFYLSFRGVCYFFVEIQCAAKDLHSVSICLSEVYVISLWRYSVLPKSYTVFLFVFQRYMLFLCGDTVCCQSVYICLSEVYVISLWRYSVLPKIYTVFLFVFQRYMLFLCGDTVCCQRSTQCFYLSFRGICYFFVEIQCAAKDLHSGLFGGTV